MKCLKRTITVILLILYATNVIKAETKQVQLKVGETSVLKIPSSVTTKTGFKVISSWRSINGSDYIDYSGYGSSVTVTVNSYTSKTIYLTCEYEYSNYGDKKETGQFEFNILISEPYFNFSASPRGGTVKKGKTVTFDCWIDNVYGFSNSQGDVKIYYTLNGATPSRNSTPYNAFYGITIEHTCTLKAIATWKGVESSVLTENYIVEDDLYLTASPSGGVVEKGTVVYLTANENGADIYYTLDGNTPSRSSTPYSSSGITINEDCTLKAIAYKNNMISDILSETYRLLVNPTEISVYLSSSTIKVGEMATANYSLKPSNASTTVTWTSEDSKIASVERSTGKVVGVSEGTTNIIATTTNGLNAQCSITVSGEIYSYVNKDNFPDINFRRSILEQGIITEEDVRNAKKLDVRGNGIESLKGIEYFTSLEELYCTWNSLYTLDLSKNTKLRILECAHCGLTTLDLSKNKLLKLLDCSLNSIKGAGMDNLINSLPSVVNGVFRVKRGDNDNNICTTTQVAAAKTKFWTPYYYDGVKNGKEIWLEYEGVELNILIDATNFPDDNFRKFLLGKDYGADGVLTEMEINILKSLDCVGEGIGSLKGIEYFTSLEELYCTWNSLYTLDLSKNTKLRRLECVRCRLTTLDLSQNKELVFLDCSLNSIKGSEMDKLIKSLPYNSNGKANKFYVIRDNTYDNVCTKAQVAAAKAKGWTPYYRNDSNNWIEYAGSDPVITIDATNFPDDNFRKYLLEQDYGKDGVITEEELKHAWKIEVSSKSIKDLKGIELFSELYHLGCVGNELSSINLSQNTKLEALYISQNPLKSLDISHNQLLRILHCNENLLVDLDISHNPALTDLSCGYNQLTSLNVSKNINLNYLGCYGNKLNSLDVSNNTELEKLTCSENMLTSLEVSKNAKLKELSLDQNKIEGVAMDKLISSLPIRIYNDGIFHVIILSSKEKNVCTKKQVSEAKKRGWIPYQYNHGWVEYSGSDDTVIDEESIAINATNFPDKNFRQYLLEQDFGKDGVITPDEINKITTIDCSKKEINNLKGIEFFSFLEKLTCVGNKLTSLDLTKNKNLNNLNCSFNHLTSLDVSKNTSLKYLSCNSNQLTSLDVSNNTNLIFLSCYSNQFIILDVSQNTSLEEFHCGLNHLTSLDVTNNTNLIGLHCYENQLASLDVSKNISLTSLSCDSNQLTSLDLTKNKNLNNLNCSFNQLTSLDVSKNTNLKDLFCSDNKIYGSAMDDLVNSLPRVSSNDGRFRVVNNPDTDGNVCTKNQVAAAKAKGWISYYYNGNWEEYEGSDPNSMDGILMDEFEDAPIYNLNGQRIDKPRKGINIIGGKKVVIK